MNFREIAANQARQGFFSFVAVFVTLIGSLACRTSPSSGCVLVVLGITSAAYAFHPRLFSFLEGASISFEGNPGRVIG